ncbi:MAG: insulinase family protein [candidate division WOR-3 bacterium]|nr:MAG: insulinase family protein [candidate division WOR-3 bacterium]
MKYMVLFLLVAVVLHGSIMERDTLDNGLIVISIEAHKIPVVEMRAVIFAGSVFDPSGVEGLANITSQMLVRGTESRVLDSIVRSIESVGGELSAFAAEDYAGLRGRALSKDIGLLMELFSDCLQNPRFDSGELENVKREVIGDIKVDTDRPFNLIDRAFRKLVFGDHPLGHYPNGYDSTVALITEDDVRTFYDEYYSPNNAFIICVGDFSKKELLSALDRHLGTWKRKEVQHPVIPEVQISDHPVGKIIPMDISQAYIILGHQGPAVGAPDWYETRVMNFIYGGSGLTSRISWKIREEMGLAYVAYSRFYRFQNSGLFAAEVQTRKEMANQVVQELLNEMKRLDVDVQQDELDRAKQYYIGHFPLSYDTYREMAQMAGYIEIEKLGGDYLEKFPDYIEAVDLDKVKTATRNHLHPERFYLMVVGDVSPEDIQVEGIEWVE